MVKVIVFIRDPVPRILKIQNDSGDVRCEVELGVNPTIINLLDELAKQYGSEVKDPLLWRMRFGLWPLSVVVNYTAIAGPDTSLRDGDIVNIHLAAVTGGCYGFVCVWHSLFLGRSSHFTVTLP